MGPLNGVKILDIGHYGVGPVGTSLLGALGANVIKLEQPDRGDGIHLAGPYRNGLSVTYTACNLNKRSIVLDLQSEDGRSKAETLVREADVLSQNYRPGVAERLGLGPEQALALNGNLVYCSFPGWGGGPLADRPMTAPIAEAFSGAANITGSRGGPPQLDGYAHIFDANASLYVMVAILLGLLARESTGKGQLVEITQLGGSLALQITRIAEFFASRTSPPRMGSACTVTVPHQAFRCQDEKYIAVGVTNDAQWAALVRALGSQELALDRKFSTNPQRVEFRGELVSKLEEIFASKPSRWWTIKLTKHGVPNGYFYDFENIRFHPQVLENEHLVIVDIPHQGLLYIGGCPWKFSLTPAIRKAAPYPGQHQEEILKHGFIEV